MQIQTNWWILQVPCYVTIVVNIIQAKCPWIGRLREFNFQEKFLSIPLKLNVYENSSQVCYFFNVWMFAATYSWASHPGFPLMLSRERGWTRQTLSSRPGNDLTYSSWFVWSNSVCLKITPLMSNTRNTREANLEGSPLGKNCRENHIKFSWTNKCTTSQAICGTCSISKQLEQATTTTKREEQHQQQQ